MACVSEMRAEETETNALVVQSFIVTPLEEELAMLVRPDIAGVRASDVDSVFCVNTVARGGWRHRARERDYKIMVFFTTARQTQLVSELFVALGGRCARNALAQVAGGSTSARVVADAARRAQAHRTRIADQFRSGVNLIMFSSDVSARGMDYAGACTVLCACGRRAAYS